MQTNTERELSPEIVRGKVLARFYKMIDWPIM